MHIPLPLMLKSATNFCRYFCYFLPLTVKIKTVLVDKFLTVILLHKYAIILPKIGKIRQCLWGNNQKEKKKIVMVEDNMKNSGWSRNLSTNFMVGTGHCNNYLYNRNAWAQVMQCSANRGI